jgi:hypothetical protein
MSSQSIIVDYSDIVVTCELCQESNMCKGNIIKMEKCHHIFDISCLINYACCKNKFLCPICIYPYEDIRISLAVAYKKQNTQEFIEALLK